MQNCVAECNSPWCILVSWVPNCGGPLCRSPLSLPWEQYIMSVYFGHLSCVNESTPNFQLSFWYDFLCRPLTTERIWSKVLPKRAELPAAHAERPFGLSTSARLQIDWCRSAPARYLSLRSQQPFPSQSFTAVELRAKAQCVCVSNFLVLLWGFAVVNRIK